MKKRSGFKVMTGLIGLVKPLAGYMVLAVMMGVAGSLCATFITILGGYGILSVLGFDVSFSLIAIFIVAVVLAVFRAGLHYGEQACNHYLAFKLLALIRDKVFAALRRLCPAKLEGRDKGDLISLITSDTELLEVFYAHTISPICIATIFSLLMVIFISCYHIILGIIALVAYLVVGALIPCLISKFSGDHGALFREQSGALSSFVLESLRGLGEIQQYGYGKKRLQELKHRSDSLSAEEQKMKETTGRDVAVTGLVIYVFDIIMIAVAALLYQNGKVDFDGVIIPSIALMGSFGPCIALANLGSTLQSTFAAGNRILDILEEEPVLNEISGYKNIDFDGASVTGVTFSYGEETILSNVNCTIERGSITGITGRSGSGKSTLLKLLMRFWETDEGKIRISGRNINKINTSNLRDMEGYVTQDTHLFHDSIKNNLLIAKLDATDEEIVEACKKASVHDFIMTLPQGYDSPAGELGDILSGGERQRIGLARAFLHNSDLMLLDEPTSNLDSLNEAVILKSLYDEKGERTVVLVSHRPSTMKIADTVYSVESGRLS